MAQLAALRPEIAHQTGDDGRGDAFAGAARSDG